MSDSNRRTILLVESDGLSADHIKHKLEQMEFFVELYLTSSTALERISARNGVYCGVVSLNTQSGNLTGLSLARKLCESVPVVVVSTNSVLLRRARQEGFIVFDREQDDDILSILIRRAYDEHNLRKTVDSMIQTMKESNSKIENLTTIISRAAISFDEGIKHTDMRLKQQEDELSAYRTFRESLEKNDTIKIMNEVLPPVSQILSLRNNWIIEKLIVPTIKFSFKFWIIPASMISSWFYLTYIMPYQKISALENVLLSKSEQVPKKSIETSKTGGQ